MNIRNDGTFCIFGAQTLLQRLGPLVSEAAAVKTAGDIEAIHDLRVASRRLRTAFHLFQTCLPAGKIKAWEKELARTTKRLGRARDLDVQIDFLQRFFKNLSQKKDQPGIKRLLLRLTQNRQNIQSRVLKTLDRLEEKKVVPEMQQALGQALARAKIAQAPKTSPYLYQQASTAISQRLAELLSFEPLVLNRPEAKPELHQMRIAAKHLRYTMEVFEPLFQDDLKEPIRAVRMVQQVLGRIHDCDVWIECLPDFLDDERLRTVKFFGQARSFNRLKPGLATLREDREACRSRLFQEFCDSWNQTNQQDLWNHLSQLLQTTRPPLVTREIEHEEKTNGSV